MLRKVLIATLLTCIVTLTVGVRVSYMYCEGELTFSGFGAKACSTKATCCSFGSDFFSLTDDYLSTEQETSDIVKIATPVQLLFSWRGIQSALEVGKGTSMFAREGTWWRVIDKVPLHILFCSFRI